MGAPIQSRASSLTPFTGTGGQTFSLAFSSAPASGNLLVVGLDIGTSPTGVTITDSKGNHYTQVNECHNAAAGVQKSCSLWAAKCVSSGIPTVTVSFNLGIVSNSTNVALIIAEYAADITVDANTQNNATSNVCTGPALVTSQAPELLIAVGIGVGGAFTLAGGGFTNRQTVSSEFALSDSTVFATGTYTPSGTQTSSSWYGIVGASFKSGVFAMNGKANYQVAQYTSGSTAPAPASRAAGYTFVS